MKKIVIISMCVLLVLVSGLAYNYANRPAPLPTRDILKNVTSQNTQAERKEPAQVKKWHGIFQKFKDTARQERLDLYEMQKTLEAKLNLPVDSTSLVATVVNDSILFIEKWDSPSEKERKDKFFISPHNYKYIFHSNGDIEVKIGNLVSRSEADDSNNDGTFLRGYLDGETGLVINYAKKDLGTRNSYSITEDGEIEKSNAYHDGYAAKLFAHLDNFLELMEEALKKK